MKTKIGKIIFHDKLISSEQITNGIDILVKNLRLKIKYEKPVAVYVNRSPELLKLILSMYKENITFLLLDSNLPEVRMKYMIEAAEVSQIIVSEKKEFFSEYEQVLLKDLFIENSFTPERPYSKENPVYILYTSGSTGNPKGIAVNKTGFDNFIESVPSIVNVNEDDTILCMTSVSFDIFFLESVMSLLSGLTVVLADDEERLNSKKILNLIQQKNISILQITPSRLKQLQFYDKEFSFLENIRSILVGGEVFSERLLQDLQENTKVNIYNMYGPTETTIWSTISNLTNKQCVDLGKPIANTTIWILKERKEPVGEGEAGEICIGGKGLADGYYHNEKLTARSFITLPFEPYEKVYCTGDSGKYENGKLIYIGRIDNQVKIRGYRVELEEVEKVICSVEGIEDCAVAYDKERELFAAFFLADAEMNENTLREKLQDCLPEYMIPDTLVRRSSLVYTVSGKKDRKAMLSELQKEDKAELLENTGSIEEQVIQILKKYSPVNIEIVGQTPVKDLGLDSIKYVSSIVEMEDVFEIEFDEEHMLENSFSSVNEIIDYINGEKNND